MTTQAPTVRSGEFSALPGVSAVTVDLPTGVVTVHSYRAISHAEAAVAANEAGYELA